MYNFCCNNIPNEVLLFTNVIGLTSNILLSLAIILIVLFLISLFSLIIF